MPQAVLSFKSNGTRKWDGRGVLFDRLGQWSLGNDVSIYSDSLICLTLTGKFDFRCYTITSRFRSVLHKYTSLRYSNS